MEKEARLKKLIYRSQNRGTKENCLLLGQFAYANLPSFKDTEIDLYERFLDEDDNDILDWIMERKNYPKQYSQFLEKLKS